MPRALTNGTHTHTHTDTRTYTHSVVYSRTCGYISKAGLLPRGRVNLPTSAPLRRPLRSIAIKACSPFKHRVTVDCKRRARNRVAAQFAAKSPPKVLLRNRRSRANKVRNFTRRTWRLFCFTYLRPRSPLRELFRRRRLTVAIPEIDMENEEVRQENPAGSVA